MSLKKSIYAVADQLVRNIFASFFGEMITIISLHFWRKQRHIDGLLMLSQNECIR